MRHFTLTPSGDSVGHFIKQNVGKLVTLCTHLSLFCVMTSLANAGSLSIASGEPKPVVNANRSVYMNGVDISSTRSQDVRNVHVKIDEYGNIFITAPHYQVTEQETFTPLSSYKHSANQMEHKPAQQMPTMREKSTSAKVGGDSALAAPIPAPAVSAPEIAPARSPLEQPAAAKAPQ